MQKNLVKQQLKAGGWALGTCLTEFFSPEAVTVVKAAGLDYFFIDCEHARASFADIQTLVRVARAAEVVPLVRVTDTEYHLIARTLDVGAFGVIIPRCDSPEQARKAVECVKFPPSGKRGYGMRGIVTDYNFRGARIEMDSANDETMIILQMESQTCVDCIDDVVAVPGVDATMVGPFDLSVSLGIPGEFDHPKFWDAFDRMVEACNRHGVAPGVHAGNPTMLQKCKEHGARFLTCGTDMSTLLRGFKEIRTAFPTPEGEPTAKAGYM